MTAVYIVRPDSQSKYATRIIVPYAEVRDAAFEEGVDASVDFVAILQYGARVAICVDGMTRRQREQLLDDVSVPEADIDVLWLLAPKSESWSRHENMRASRLVTT